MQFDDESFQGFRSVHIGPSEADPGLWLFLADTTSEAQFPSLVLYSDDLDQDAEHLVRIGTDVTQPLQGEPGAGSIQVRDPRGILTVLTDAPG